MFLGVDFKLVEGQHFHLCIGGDGELIIQSVAVVEHELQISVALSLAGCHKFDREILWRQGFDILSGAVTAISPSGIGTAIEPAIINAIFLRFCI